MASSLFVFSGVLLQSTAPAAWPLRIFERITAARLARMASKKLTSTFSMVIGAGKATLTATSWFRALSTGLKLMDFCKAFNDQTSIYKDGVQVAGARQIYSDRTFTFETFTHFNLLLSSQGCRP